MATAMMKMPGLQKVFPPKRPLAMMNRGGRIRGPGTGTSDSVLARVSNGEDVLPADTVQAVGQDNIDQLIAQTHTPVRRRLADGGPVTTPPGPYSIGALTTAPATAAPAASLPARDPAVTPTNSVATANVRIIDPATAQPAPAASGYPMLANGGRVRSLASFANNTGWATPGYVNGGRILPRYDDGSPGGIDPDAGASTSPDARTVGRYVGAIAGLPGSLARSAAKSAYGAVGRTAVPFLSGLTGIGDTPATPEAAAAPVAERAPGQPSITPTDARGMEDRGVGTGPLPVPAAGEGGLDPDRTYRTIAPGGSLAATVPAALPPEGSDVNPGPYHTQYLAMQAKQRADQQSQDQAILAGDRSRAEVTNQIQARLDLANAEQAARASGGLHGNATDRRLALAKVAALRPIATAAPTFAGAPQRNYVGEAEQQQRTQDAALTTGQAVKTAAQAAPLALASQQLGLQRTGQEVQMGQYQVALQHHLATLAAQAAQGGEQGQQATDTLALWQKAMKGEGGPLTPHEQAQLYLNYASRALLPGMDAGAVQNMIPPQVFMSMVSGRGGAANAPGATMEGQPVRGKAGTPYEGKTGRIVNGQFVPD